VSVRIKLDENIPASAATVATQLGHDADTVVGEELAGAADVDVLAASSGNDRILITLDRGFGDVRAYPPGTHGGVVILRVDSRDASTVTEAVRSFLVTQDLGDLTGCIVVVRGGGLRLSSR
jgi:predicted nuclease of predicted toxin-antitoxin system